MKPLKLLIQDYLLINPTATFCEVAKALNRDPNSVRHHMDSKHRAKSAQRSLIARRKFLSDLRLEKGNACNTCGYDKLPEILEFHHIDPKTKIGCVIDLAYKSYQLARQEAQKCSLLCPTCHAEIHFLWRKNGADGTTHVSS